MCMPRTKLPKGSVPVTVRLPQQIQRILTAKARREKISFSELVRRALCREIKTSGPHMNGNSRE
jgi:predicted HicB family RNase H-like nuclease